MKIPATLKIEKRNIERDWIEETKGFIVFFLPFNHEIISGVGRNPGAIFVSEKGEISYRGFPDLTVDMDEF